MTTNETEATDRVEELTVKEQHLLDMAAQFEAMGFAASAKSYRNKARGVRAARTAWLRREGWLS